MPPEKQKKQDLLRIWKEKDPELYTDLRVIEDDLYCDICGRFINSSAPSKVKRHVNGHTSTQREDSKFFYDLTDAFLAADIPLEKLNHPKLCAFFEKYVDQHLPHPNTLRLRYVDQVYTSVMQNMRKDIGDNFVYFVVDEATDVRDRSVTNFIIGALRADRSSDSHLVASKVLENINHETLVAFVNDCFNYVWLSGTDYSDKVLVMISEASAYMLKAGEILSHKYENMVHFTCAADAFNRVAESIRAKFPLVNKLISNIKEIFLKAPTRREVFRKALPAVPLPPESIVTRWGTWLQAVGYYDDHFEDVKAVINRFDSQESEAIHGCQEVMNDQNIREDIRYINSTYSVLVSSVTKLGIQGLSLNEQFRILDEVKHKVCNSAGPFNADINAKLVNVFQKNPGYSVLEDICRCINDADKELPPSILKYNSCINNFSYCPLSSVDVERLFTLQKNILQYRRKSLTAKNLEKLVIIKFAYRGSCTE